MSLAQNARNADDAVMLTAPMPKYNLRLELPVYSPDEDSFLLMDAMYCRRAGFEPRVVAEVGCGYGCAGVLMAQLYNTSLVLVDVNPDALRCAAETAQLNCVAAQTVHSDLLSAVPNCSDIDMICFNPPYVPGELREEDMFDKALCGGIDGREVIDRFLDELNVCWATKQRCSLYLICISKNRVDELMQRLRAFFDVVECVKTKQLETERLHALFCERLV